MDTGYVEILEPDGLCHWKMQCEHGITECYDPEGHDGPHENEQLCEQMRAAGQTEAWSPDA